MQALTKEEEEIVNSWAELIMARNKGKDLSKLADQDLVSIGFGIFSETMGNIQKNKADAAKYLLSSF